jgi:hypothetical protein
MKYLVSSSIYYLTSFYVLNYLNNSNFYISSGFLLLNDFLSFISSRIIFSRISKYIITIKSMLLYMLIVQRYMFMNVNLYQKNNSIFILYFLINILYLLNFITFIDRINKIGFTMFNKLSFYNFIQLIVSSNIIITLFLQYMFLTNLSDDLINIKPFIVSYIIHKTNIIWNFSYIFSFFLVNS